MVVMLHGDESRWKIKRFLPGRHKLAIFPYCWVMIFKVMIRKIGIFSKFKS